MSYRVVLDLDEHIEPWVREFTRIGKIHRTNNLGIVAAHGGNLDVMHSVKREAVRLPRTDVLDRIRTQQIRQVFSWRCVTKRDGEQRPSSVALDVEVDDEWGRSLGKRRGRGDSLLCRLPERPCGDNQESSDRNRYDHEHDDGNDGQETLLLVAHADSTPFVTSFRTCQPARRRRAAIWRSRRILRRSRSDMAPQIPNFSLETIANSRHSARTEHSRQICFAVRVDAPRSGKNRSGSAPRQLAKSCQARSTPSACRTSMRSGNTCTPWML